MKETLRVWAVVTFMILATIIQMNVMADAEGSKYLKEDLELAVHDAGMCLDKSQLANGKIVFDQKMAYNAFVKSLEVNAHLKMVSPGLKNIDPTNRSFFQNAFKVVTFKVIDDSNADFPYTYHHPLYDLDMRYDGPTIVAVIETYGPRYFSGRKRLIRRAASYTYKLS